MKKNIFSGFTLVELIIVITILAILSTIGFVSFQSFTKDTRDSQRLTTLNNLEKGLTLYNVKTSLFPEPDNIYGTGNINNQVLSYVGEFGESVSKRLGVSKVPKDPLSDVNYVYGTTSDYKSYQISGILESQNYTKNNLVNNTYADGILKAKVTGNYKSFLKYNSGSEVFISNIPSLLFSNTGGTNLLSTTTYFIVDKSTNIPYTRNGIKDQTIRQKDGNTIIREVTKNSTSTLTGINITGLNNNNIGTYFTGEVLRNFNTIGLDITNTGAILESLKNNLLGNTQSTTTSSTGSSNPAPSNSCNSTLPANATTTIGSPSSVNQAWQSSNPSSPCYFECNIGYGSNGTSCVSSPTQCTPGTPEITLSNGQTWQCKNLGATTVRDGITQPTNCYGSSTNCNSGLTWLGNYYQWGRNDTGFTNGNSSSPFNYGWESQNNTKWGGSTGDTPTVNGAGTTSLGRQGPCPTGYHVPSIKEWQDMCNNVLGITCTDGMSYNSLIVTKLRLPFAGSRSDTGDYYTQSSNANYWSSSPNSIYSYKLSFDTSNVYPASYSERAGAVSLRCIKN